MARNSALPVGSHRPLLRRRSFLVPGASLLALLTGAACGDGPVAVRVGDAYLLAARTESFYDCAPNPALDPVDPGVCGTRTDTVEVEALSLEGLLTVREIRNTTPQAEPGDPPSTLVQSDLLVADGELAESRCGAECVVEFQGEREARVSRSTYECRGIASPAECQGREDGTSVQATVSVGAQRQWLLRGEERGSGRMDGDTGAVRESGFSRSLTRTVWSLIPTAIRY